MPLINKTGGLADRVDGMVVESSLIRAPIESLNLIALRTQFTCEFKARLFIIISRILTGKNFKFFKSCHFR